MEMDEWVGRRNKGGIKGRLLERDKVTLKRQAFMHMFNNLL